MKSQIKQTIRRFLKCSSKHIQNQPLKNMPSNHGPEYRHTSEYLRNVKEHASIIATKLVNVVVSDAVHAQATDIHFEPIAADEGMRMRLRINGHLKDLEYAALNKADREHVIGRLRSLAGMDSFRDFEIKEGAADFLLEDESNPASKKKLRLRLSFFPTQFGHKVVIRLKNSNLRSHDLNSTFDSESKKEIFEKMLDAPSGLVILSGPTGSGKTTAAYSALSYIHRKRPEDNICTIEDPVEALLPGISQTELSPDHGFTYAKALRGLLRQNPQVILIGEIRDKDTAEIAVQAGFTGTFVIASLHSESSAGAISRLSGMGIEPFLVASSVIGVVSVRLPRQLCECKTDHQINTKVMERYRLDKTKRNQFKTNNPKGCDHCKGTGYSEFPCPIAEILKMNPQVRDLMLQKLPSRQFEARAMAASESETLWQAGIAKLYEGEISLAELIRCVNVPEFGIAI